MSEPLHFSRLKLMAQSPAHFKRGYRTDTRPLTFGTTVHALVLGGEIIVYDGERTGSGWAAFKAIVAGEPTFVFDGPHRGNAWAEAKEEAAGRVIVTSMDEVRAKRARALQDARRASGRYLLPIVTREEYDRAAACAESVLENEEATAMLRGAREVPLTWRYHNRDCAGQLDVLGSSHISELKTTACAEPEWFRRQTFKMAYHSQLRWYSEAAVSQGFKPRDHFIVAVETRPPYAVTPFRVTERALEEGERLLCQWLERLAVCEAANSWPAYCQSTVDLDASDGEVNLIWGDEGVEGEAA